MEYYKWEKPLREDRHRHRRDNPSFSSSLLDAIYRSIDESNGREEEEEEEVIFYKETMRKKKQNNNGLKLEGGVRKEEELTSFQRACMMEIKKVGHEKGAFRRKSMEDSLEKPPWRYLDKPVLLNSSSTSSNSSSGSGFSSSESEGFHGRRPRTTSSTYTVHRLGPIRTNTSTIAACQNKAQAHMYLYNEQERELGPNPKPKHDGGFGKTKSKALKIYGDLKKVKLKQPISPGSRLASFLNSLFMARNAKKAKISSSSPSSGYAHDHRQVKSEKESTCSSASSFSRSCLSKTPSSRGKLSENSNNGAKRSVTFYPFSVIVDEDSKPCGHKNLYGSEESLMAITTKRRSPINEELRIHVEDFARDLLKTYNINKKLGEDVVFGNEDEDEEEEDDDGASDASSDLFELDNLSSIGIDQMRYREELPVYETTHLGTNQAIANGLLV